MQFQVPQFETESKIVGPFTLVQFIYIGVTAVICFLLFSVLQIWLWLFISAILVGVALAFALIRINGRPMSVFSVAVFNYFWQPKVLVYRSPSAITVGLRHIRPAVTPGKKLEVPVKQPVPEEIVAIPGIVPEQITRVTPPTRPSAPLTVPIVPTVPVVKAPAVPPKTPQSLLQGLFNRITVSSSPIPQRESSLKKELTASKQKYAVIQRSTGESEVVKRVDYR